MRTRIARREFAKSVIDDVLRRYARASFARPHRAFLHLLWNVQARSAMLRPSRAVGRVAKEPVERLVSGLVTLVEHRNEWLRPVEEWEPRGGGPTALFSSLAHHLLANYPTPPVLLSAWFRGNDWFAQRARRWFKHLGRGESLRRVGWAIPLNRRMAHEFAHAPADFPIEFALRWAQVRGLGGSDRLARAVASTRLAGMITHEDFWVSVIHLFLNTPRLDLDLVGPIVDYLYDQKFRYQPVLLGDGTEVHLSPPRPDLTVKGRTVASLARRAEEWRAHLKAEAERRHFRWGPLGLRDYRREDLDGRAWTVVELLDSDALAAEGKAMDHCVATYTDHCLHRRSSIWSLGLEGPAGREPRATIEVDPETRAVLQAKGRGNEPPDDLTRAVLHDWAAREGLNVEDCDYGP